MNALSVIYSQIPPPSAFGMTLIIISAQVQDKLKMNLEREKLAALLMGSGKKYSPERDGVADLIAERERDLEEELNVQSGKESKNESSNNNSIAQTEQSP
jgi:hypothetical protein